MRLIIDRKDLRELGDVSDAVRELLENDDESGCIARIEIIFRRDVHPVDVLQQLQVFNTWDGVTIEEDGETVDGTILRLLCGRRPRRVMDHSELQPPAQGVRGTGVEKGKVEILD
ncbi:MAG TPA: hypothetical protein VHM88_27395 [Candidatus Acidoferrales bacterium]|nr:hypothetical protein [Candidatus Acidoferrales bacterium]